MKSFWVFVTGLIVKLFFWVIGQKPKVEDGAAPNKKTDSLRDKIKKGKLWQKFNS